MKYSPIAILLLVCFSCVGLEARGQTQDAVIHATVADAASEQFLMDAEVTVLPFAKHGMTDFLGNAWLSGIKKGTYSVSVRKLGYQPLSAAIKVSNSDTLEVILLMLPIARGLPDITVKDTLQSPLLREFEERRRQGKGYYITDAELRAFQGADLSSIVQSKIPGLRIGYGPLGALAYSTRGKNSWRNTFCFVNAYYNGRRVDPNATLVPLDFIGGIEYYPTGRVPVEYQEPGNDCGVLLIWARP